MSFGDTSRGFSEWSLGGIDLTLDDFDRICSHVPLLVDLQPAGRFLMDDLYRAGGLLAVLREVRDLLDPTAVTGRPLVDYLDAAPIWDPEVIGLDASLC
jgi:dihydroxyacid dehydratase/phosphogluconate dehydratase